MAYRRKSSRSASSRGRKSYSARKAPYKRKSYSKPRKSYSKTSRRAPARKVGGARQQILRIVLTHEGVNPVQRPLDDGSILASSVAPAGKRRARF